MDFSRSEFSHQKFQPELLPSRVVGETQLGPQATLLKPDPPDFLTSVIISALPASISNIDENIGNQIGLPDDEKVEQRYTGTLKLQQDNLKNILGQE